ncbi:hypothetical protein [Kutzneria chonburiensis]|uniref:hypothetical protein n=1 Tax=Kutzneria chonburiensis TaxID=1483604 RepID=UPI00235FF73E|nr:hypothetical protein [Kutzneria chonburiensis]
MFTAWDGYARVDYLPEPGRIQVTLLTVEPTVYRQVRPGLACAFAADDAVGPPTFVGMDIGFGLTDDEMVLLGALASVASELMTARSGSRTARLALDEVAELAETWTPYRAPVLAESTDDAPARTGVWGSELWTRLSGLGLAAALVAQSPGHLAGFRSGGGPATGSGAIWRFPPTWRTPRVSIPI